MHCRVCWEITSLPPVMVSSSLPPVSLSPYCQGRRRVTWRKIHRSSKGQQGVETPAASVGPERGNSLSTVRVMHVRKHRLLFGVATSSVVPHPPQNSTLWAEELNIAQKRLQQKVPGMAPVPKEAGRWERRGSNSRPQVGQSGLGSWARCSYADICSVPRRAV